MQGGSGPLFDLHFLVVVPQLLSGVGLGIFFGVGFLVFSGRGLLFVFYQQIKGQKTQIIYFL